MQQTASGNYTKKKLKDMTEAEKKDYKRQKQKERRKNMDDTKKEEVKEKDRINKETKRAQERLDNAQLFKNKMVKKRAEQRRAERPPDEPKIKTPTSQCRINGILLAY